MTNFLLASAVVLAACGGKNAIDAADSPGDEPTTPKDAAQDPVPTNAPIGVWHFEEVDATNIAIQPDRTFKWTIEGCDFGGGDCGVWEGDPAGELVLKPAAGKETFTWSYDGSFAAGVRSIRVQRSGEDLTMVGVLEDGGTFNQKWQAGQECAICGGALGPTGKRSCNTPLPNNCRP